VSAFEYGRRRINPEWNDQAVKWTAAQRATKGKWERVSVCLSYQHKFIFHSRAQCWSASLCASLTLRAESNQLYWQFSGTRQVREGSKFITIRPSRWLALHLFLSCPAGVCVFALAVTYAAQISIFHFSRCITNQSVRRPKLHLFIGTPSTLSSRRHFQRVCGGGGTLVTSRWRSSQTNQAPVASPETWSHWWILIRHGHVID
jgi:hypothetical protein